MNQFTNPFTLGLLSPARQSSRRSRALFRMLEFALAACISLPALASGDIYEYMDDNGVLTITNVGATRPITVHLRNGPAAALQRLGRRASGGAEDPYKQQVEDVARLHAIDPALLHAIIAVESDNSQSAVSRKGAIGLMQVLPETGKRFGITDLFNPAHNIEAGARYLRVLAALFNNDLSLVLAAYNAGENAVARFGNRIPPYPETKNYVSRVIEDRKSV